MVVSHHNMLRAQYLENRWRCYLATIWIVCCEAVRSAILATAWLLVIYRADGVVCLLVCSSQNSADRENVLRSDAQQSGISLRQERAD